MGGGGGGGCKKIMSIFGKTNIFAQKISSRTPGRYSGNIIIFMDSPIATAEGRKQHRRIQHRHIGIYIGFESLLVLGPRKIRK